MYNTLLEPIAGDAPCGSDLSATVEFDAIAKARRHELTVVSVAPPVDADWPFVAARCHALLAGRSKDLRLAVWLTEANAKMGELRAIGDGLYLLAGLCARHWHGVHPLPDESGQAPRIRMLCWIAARAPCWLRELPIIQDETATFTLGDVDMVRLMASSSPVHARRAGRMEAARRHGEPKFYDVLRADAQHCLDASAALQAEIDERLGAAGPSFALVRVTLQAMLDAALPMGRAHAPAPPIETRAQALSQLRQVAEFLRRTEPHSSISYLTGQAAGLGEQSLRAWLLAIVNDPAAMARLEQLPGWPPGER